MELKSEVASLVPYKESCEKAERKRIETEIAEKKTELSAKMISSKLFTPDDIESPEIKVLIDNVDEAAIKAMMADRLMAMLDAADSSDAESKSTVETSEVASTTVKANIESDYYGMSFSELMKTYEDRNKERGK